MSPLYPPGRFLHEIIFSPRGRSQRGLRQALFVPFQKRVGLVGLVWSRPSPPWRIAYLVGGAVRHRAAVEAGIGSALGNHRLWEWEDGGEHTAFGSESGVVHFLLAHSRSVGGGRRRSQRRFELPKPGRAYKLR